jgi:hypothetical protein
MARLAARLGPSRRIEEWALSIEDADDFLADAVERDFLREFIFGRVAKRFWESKVKSRLITGRKMI